MFDRYIGYDEYIALGGTLTQGEFAKAQPRAVNELERHTFGRLRNVETVSDAVKHCLVELIDVCANGLSMYGNPQGAPIASASNDGVSVTYATPSLADWTSKVYPQRVAEIIRTYLSEERGSDGLPLLYRGCSR